MQTLRVTHEHYIIFEITMLSTQISYKYHIYSQCRLEERPMNIIVYLKFTMLNTQISSILYLATFSVHCAVKSHVYHAKYTDFI